MFKAVRYFFVVMAILLSTEIIAQEKFTLKGYVKDSLSGETLIGASILVGNENRGVSTNQYGYFSLTLPQGNYQLIFSYIGYAPRIINIDFNTNTSRDILLLPVSSTINNV